jgi:NAD dependent epimerase/dehydratase
MNLKNKKILITGAGGFIGSHLIERLYGLGAKVKAFVHYNSRNDFGYIDYIPKDIQKNISIETGNLTDYDAVYDAMKGCDVVFHLGALIAIPYSYRHPKDSIETNVMGTYNVLNAARRLDVEKIVHTSTSEVYGTALKVPISEDHPLQGQSPYSASKIGADKIAESFYRSYNLPVATIRPFNTYGPRQSARAVIPTIITQALAGDRIHLGSLHPTRDLTFVLDTVEGFVKVAECDRSIGEVINIGSGYDISVKDLCDKILKLMNSKAKIVSKTERKRPSKSEVERLLADNSKAKKMLKWKPEYSLDEGLRLTIDWISRNIGKYKTDSYVI